MFLWQPKRHIERAFDLHVNWLVITVCVVLNNLQAILLGKGVLTYVRSAVVPRPLSPKVYEVPTFASTMYSSANTTSKALPLTFFVQLARQETMHWNPLLWFKAHVLSQTKLLSISYWVSVALERTLQLDMLILPLFLWRISFSGAPSFAERHILRKFIGLFDFYPN